MKLLLAALASLVLAAGVWSVEYAAADPEQIQRDAQVVADAATCHTLTAAAAAYYAEHEQLAASVADLAPYVSAPSLDSYSVAAGLVAGPGCP